MSAVPQESPWTVEEAAAWLKRSPEYVRRLARSGKLPGTKEGNGWRFDPAAVRARVPFPRRAVEPVSGELAATIEARLNAMAARMALRRKHA